MKIRVYWYKHPEGHGNFGDELNPYIIEKLSGKKVEFYDIHDNIQIYNFKERIHKLIFSKDRFIFLLKILKSVIGKPRPIILAIGSIIGWYYIKNVVVWGAGIMSSNDNIFPAKFLAVRGKYTQKRLEELGLKKPEVIGDPALLLPLIYNPKENKSFKLGIIPHFIHYDLLKKRNDNSEIIVINLLDPIEKIIDEITSCDVTLSTSLHGIIVSHAYNIPSRWVSFVETSEKKLGGDNIKFQDYFSSVNLPEMEILKMGSLSNFDMISKLDEIFKQSPNQFLPNSERILEIQKELLKVAPFSIVRELKLPSP